MLGGAGADPSPRPEETPPPDPLPYEGRGDRAEDGPHPPNPPPHPPPPRGEGGTRPSAPAPVALPDAGRGKNGRGVCLRLPPPGGRGTGEGSSTFLIPVCYDRGPDLAAAAAHLGLSADKVVRLHTTAAFTVHAVRVGDRVRSARISGASSGGGRGAAVLVGWDIAGPGPAMSHPIQRTRGARRVTPWT
ncbi:MAG: allophanate hydrolase subunit 1 [Gemmataceae bacterium]|nr:allophanate hydrolase subunit 1 [Gemmataceae bacterium]